MKYGVFLTRAQPLHKGHIKVIRQALTGNEYVLLIIGSANKSETIRNPIDVEIRKMIVENALDNTFSVKEKKRIKCIQLDDWSTEDAYQYVKEWGCFFYYNIVSVIHQKTFTLYYNDSEAVVEDWFEPYIRERITVRQISRDDDKISSSNIREAIMQGNREYLEQVLTENTLKYIPLIKECIERATNEDFIMK